MKRILLAAAILAVTAIPARAQGPVSLEFRTGAALPTRDLGDASLRGGPGFEGVLGFRVMPHVHLYGGWGWYHLSTDGATLLGRKYDVENNGYLFGAQFLHPVGRSVSAWVRGGGLYNHLELEDGGDVTDSGHELGWEAGAGLSIPITSNATVTPGARYRTFSGDLSVGQTTIPFDMSYAMVDIGVRWTFGGGRTQTARR